MSIVISGEPGAVGGALDQLLVSCTITLKAAMRQMDTAGKKILFVVNGDRRLLGSLTDGDIRRWILRDGSLHESIEAVYNRQPRIVELGAAKTTIRELMINGKLEAVPRVDAAGILIDVLLWNDLFADEARPRDKLGIPVLIMAGGKGQRLDPLTRILPKPLIPVGDKPMVELVMDQFDACGCDEFFLTVNYKGKLIQSYFEHDDSQYRVKLIWEESYLGTAGSLRLAAPMVNAPRLFVSNCDVLVRADYDDILNFHLQQGNLITVVASIRHTAVPFGVLQMKNGGQFDSIREKYEYDFLANTGMYLLETAAIEFIPPGASVDFPELLCAVAATGNPVGIYPVSQESWIDIGQWHEYQGALKKLERATD
jgi:dTDP-glucose pyrophosphorylase